MKEFDGHCEMQISFLVGGLVGGLVVGLTFRLITGLTFELITGLVVGLTFGLVGGLANGGSTYLKHYVLRFLLWRNDYGPWNYIRFLDYVAERVFLRKIGGGYIFTHRLLMEYFATLQPPRSSSANPGCVAAPTISREPLGRER